MKLSDETKRLLEIIENGIDEETEDDYDRQWMDFLYGRFKGDIFKPKRKKLLKTDYQFRSINVNDAVKDYELMLVDQLQGALRAFTSPGNVPSMRCNYGSGILSSLFGAEVFTMPYATNTLPTTKPLGIDALKSLLDAGMPDLYAGFGRQVFEMEEIFREVLEDYPKTLKYVAVYHPDTQGPLDICELLLGAEYFYLLYDEPDDVKALMLLICDTYTAFVEKWFTLFPNTPGMTTHWNLRHRGNICLRNDSAMNLSPEFYREFAFPYDKLLLERFDGGMVHFCGRGDHYISILSEAPKLYGINFTQPELNDMETILRNTVDKGIPILSYPMEQHAAKLNATLPREGGFHGLIYA